MKVGALNEPQDTGIKKAQPSGGSGEFSMFKGGLPDEAREIEGE